MTKTSQLLKEISQSCQKGPHVLAQSIMGASDGTAGPGKDGGKSKAELTLSETCSGQDQDARAAKRYSMQILV